MVLRVREKATVTLLVLVVLYKWRIGQRLEPIRMVGERKPAQDCTHEGGNGSIAGKGLDT
jgi:hypothetical protein